MTLETNLNASPYYDDFDENKNYHRILFKPTTAVQARELIQIQTILQNQIERFGDNILKSGAVVKGCGVTFYNTLDIVRMGNYTGANTALNIRTVANTIAVSQTTGLQAAVMSVAAGTEYPETNRIYVKYLNTGTDGSNDIKKFSPNEQLTFYTSPVSANLVIQTANTYANNVNETTIGQATALGISDGIVYQKGFFIRVDSQIKVISDNINCGNTSVGFQTSESIVTADQDTSLNDNSLGYENDTAPGADRLKLVALLHAVPTDTIANTDNFAILSQYINGVPVTNNANTQYSALGDTLAGRDFETNGSFVTKPFIVDTASGNTGFFTARVSPGVGYAKGYRIETFKTSDATVRRGNNIASADFQLITSNYGSYIVLDDYVGNFDFNGDLCTLYDTAQNAITNHNFGGISSPTGNAIGTARIRTVVHASGRSGSKAAQYRLYLYDIRINSGYDFANARSVYFVGTDGNKGFGDIVLQDGQAVLINAERSSMIFSFGQRGLKTLKDAANNINTQYYTRQIAQSTLDITGKTTLTITTSHAGGTNLMPYGSGEIGDVLESSDFMVVSTAAGQTANLAGTVSGNATSNTITGSATFFMSKFSVGEFIKIGTDVREVVSLASDTVMTVDAPLAGTAAAVNYQKYYPKGYVFPFDDSMVGTRRISGTSTTSVLIDTGFVSNTASPIPVTVYYNAQRVGAIPQSKTVLANRVVKIDTATHTAGATGPWSLGTPDVFNLVAVYAGSTYSTSNPDCTSMFLFDSGQRDTHYDLASISLKPGSTLPGTKLTVVFSAFGLNTTPGIGFFSVDSYPIDDANTANTSAITTATIPTYRSSTGTLLSLRDCVDFRPVVTDTATSTTDVTAASINPTKTWTTLKTTSDGLYVPSPDRNFQSSMQFYLGRRDVVYYNTQGFLIIKEGVPSTYPQTPSVDKDGMSVATLMIQPYPSLSSEEQSALLVDNKKSSSQIRDLSYKTQVAITTHRGYTMRDIGVLDQRISNLEYYQTLSMLEKSATDLQIPDVNGLDRFKNGIYAEPFLSHRLGQVANPEYRIAIDEKIGVARPYFTQDQTNFDWVGETSTVGITGPLISLPYTVTTFASQPYATKYRNAAPVSYHWNAQITLYPNYDAHIDKVETPAVNVTIDLTGSWDQFAASPWGTQWGSWRTSASDSTTSTQQQQSDGSTAVTTTTATTTTTARDGQKLNVSGNSQTYNLGTYVNDINIQPYIRSRQVAFYGWNFRPNTTVHAFFDNQNVDSQVAMGVRNSAVTDITSDDYVTRTANFGTPLVTDSQGRIYGKFLIEKGSARTGERTFELADVSSLVLGNTAITTMGSTTFVGNYMSLTKNAITLTTITADLSVGSTTQSGSATSFQTSTQIIPAPVIDPPKPSGPSDPGPATTCSIEISNRLRAATSAQEVFMIWRDAVTMGLMSGDQFGNFDGRYDPCNYANQGDPEGRFRWDPMAQLFNVDVEGPGIFISSVDLYFKQKSKNNQFGVTVYLTETTNGYPDTSKILSYSRKHLEHADIGVSDNASVLTRFTFPGIVFAASRKSYAIVVIPDGGDPDYLIWMAQLGDSDIATNAQVFQQPYAGTAYYGATEGAWTALPNEYVKFGVNRCDFTELSGVANFANHGYDFLNVTSPAYANSAAGILSGDRVYAATNTSVSTVNTAVTGTMFGYDSVRNILELDNSSAKFKDSLLTANTIQVHRPLPGTNNAISNNTLIATMTMNSVDNVQLNAVSPYFANITPTGTTLDWFITPTSNYVRDSSATHCVNEYETEFRDYERQLVSVSNESTHMAGQKSLLMSAKFTTRSPLISPIIDTVRMGATVIGNLIDPTTYNLATEYGSQGKAKTKYLSVPVTLAKDQDAEDLQVYVTAYKPIGSEIAVFVRFLSGADNDLLGNKTWTRLDVDDPSVFSDYQNTTDYREYLYNVPTSIAAGAPSTTAYQSATDPLKYVNAVGATYQSFKQFQIKIVLLSDTTARVPILNDVRAIALQL